MKQTPKLLLAAVMVAAPMAAAAGPMTYRPVNPAFGGDPFNGDFLLSTANAQKETRPFPTFDFDRIFDNITVIDARPDEEENPPADGANQGN